MKKLRNGKVGIIIALAAAISCSSAIAISQLCSKDFSGAITAYADASSEATTPSVTAEEMTSLWNTAVQESKDTGNAVTVTLEDDWTALEDETYTTSFGTGDGFDNGRLYVPADANIVLDLNGHTIDRALKEAVQRGIVVYVAGTLEICDSQSGGTITGGNTFESYGGGVFVDAGGTLEMTSGTITGNTAGLRGGGVYVNGGTFNMSGGEISDNSAVRGGGVYFYGGTSNMTGGTISGNSSTYVGGVYVNSSATFTMTGGTISGNSASDNIGGVGCFTGSTFTMNDGTISENTAKNGGALFINGGKFNMGGGTISNNTAAVDGGGVYSYGNATNPAVISITGGSISGNTATEGTGGGIYSGSYCSLTLENGTISDNTAVACGGVYVTNSTSKFIINGGTISGNTASKNIGGVGCVSGSTFTMTDGTISENTAENGGGIFISGGKFNMSGGTISNNIAASTGGGVYGFGNTTNPAVISITGGTISGNTATTGNGGGIYSGSYCTFTLENGTISDNTSSGNGGGVQVNNSTSNFIMNGGTISGNTANNYGGGAYVYKGTFTLVGGTIGGSKDNANTANFGAGVYITTSAKFEMSGGTISENTANSVGGVYVAGSSIFEMNGGTISGNTAENGNVGGVACVTGCTFTMSDGTITENTATSNGGGLFVNGGTFNMSGGIISKNTATKGGGGVYSFGNESNQGIIYITGGEISGNTATEEYGGGIYSGAYGLFTLEGGTISGNTANKSGGGVYVTNSTSNFIMSGGEISGNTATTENGGGVYTNIGTFTMTGGTISGNTAATNGGGVVASASASFTIGGGTISGNTATTNGGGIYAYSPTINVYGGIVLGNTKDDDSVNNVCFSSTTGVITVPGKLAANTFIGVYATSARTITSGYTSSGNKTGKEIGYFVSDNASYEISNNGTEVTLIEGTSTPVVRSNVDWSYVSQNASFTSSETVELKNGEFSATATYTGGAFVFDAVKNGIASAVDENGRAVTNFTNVGKYYLTVSYAEKPNYINPSFNFEILPADISKANVTVKAESVVYTASEVSTSVKVFLDGIMLEENVDYTVSYRNNVKAGDATVVINGMGNYKGIYNGTFKIVKAKLGVRWGLTTLPYSGSEQDIIALPEGLLGDDSVTFTITYYDKNGEQVIPVNVGEYKAVVTLDDANYQLFRVYEETFTIVQKKVDAVWSATSFTYNGETHTLTAYFMAGDEKVNLTVSAEDLVSAGTHKATTVLPEGYDNYVLTPNTAEITYVIEKAEVEAVWPNGYDFKYDAQKKEIAVTVKLGDLDFSDSVTYTYYDESGNEVEPIVAGTYKVVITIPEGNYVLKGKTEDTFVIAKATIVVTWNDDYDSVYTGEGKTPLSSVKDSLNNVLENYSATYVKVNANGDVVKNLGKTLPTDVGSYFVSVEADDENIEKVVITKPFDITPKTIQVEWDFGDLATEIDGVQTYLYDGATHQPTAKADGIQLTVTGSGKSVRDGYRTVASLNNANYVLAGDTQVTFNVIQSKVISVIWYEHGKTEPVEEGVTPSYEYISVYGQQEGAKLSAYGVLAAYDANVEWNNEHSTLLKLNVTYPEYFEGFWELGTYTAKAVLSSADSANYACYMPLETDNTLEFKVTKVTHSAHVADILWVVINEDGTHSLAKDCTFTYNGQKQAPVAIRVLSNSYKSENPLEGTYEILKVGGAKINAGTYYAYIIPEGNYEIKDEDAEFKFVIKPLEITIEWGETTFDYDGNKQAPEATVKGAEGFECNVTVEGYVNAGTYTATAKVGKNFTIVSGAETEFTIKQVKLSVDDIVWGFNEDDEGAERTDANGTRYFAWTFDGNTHVPAATLKVQLEEDGEEVEINLAVTGGASAAGTHYAYVTLESSDPTNANYELEIARIRFDIVYTSVTVIWEEEVDGEIVFGYNGELHTPKAYYVVGEGDDATRVYLHVVGGGINAGKYVAVITDNIDSPDGLTKEFTIKAQQIKVEWTNTSVEYNGNVRTPSVSFVDFETEEAVTLTLGVDYTVKGFVNAGTYTSEITLISGNYEIADASGEHEFTISKKSITLTWYGVDDSTENFVWNYDGNKYAPKAETGIDGLEVTVKGAELQVGEYTAVAILDNDNYIVTNPEQEFTIKGSTISVIWDFENALTGVDEDGETYYYWQYEGDGAVYAPKAYIKQADGSKGGPLTVVGGGIYAGTHTAKAILPANCSWAEGETGECQFVISKKIVDGIIWTDENGNKLDEFDWEYDGKYHAPSAKIASSGEVLTVIGAQLNVCDDGVTYTATAILANSDNYEFASGAEDGKIFEKEFKIHAKPVSVTWKGETGSDKDKFVWTYDSEVHCPTAWFKDVNEEWVEIPVVGGTATSGQYVAELRGDIFTNYVFDENLTRDFTIKEIGATATWNGTYEEDENGKIIFTYTYNGKAQMPDATAKTVVTDEEAEGKPVRLDYLIKDEDGSAVSAIINVGTYTVTVISSDKNHKITEGETTVTVKVEPKPVAVQWGDTTLTANGSAQVPKAWFVDVNGQKIELTVEGAQTEVNGEGEIYTATATLETGNYKLDEDSEEYPVTTTFTIVLNTAKEYKWVWDESGNGKWVEVKDETDSEDGDD